MVLAESLGSFMVQGVHIRFVNYFISGCLALLTLLRHEPIECTTEYLWLLARALHRLSCVLRSHRKVLERILPSWVALEAI